ncbi:MAG: glycosyltransferase family 39 protein, partial [Actinomycetota bacterium]
SATHFSPLFPLITAGLGKLTGDFVLSAYIMVIIFGTLLLAPAYLLARDLAGGRAGLMAAALVGAMPLFVDYSSRLYSESVYVFFLLLALAAGYRILQDGSRYAWAALAGFSLGLAYLANPSAVFYLAALLVLLAGAAVVKHRPWRPLAGRAALFAVLFTICAAPYIIFLH